jgi:DNA-binding SARP family transcriptional activator
VYVQLLGPVRVDSDGEIAIGGRQQQLLLARLVAAAGVAVSRARLIEDLWDGRRVPVDRLHEHVAELRAALSRCGRQTRARIPTSVHGTYRAEFEAGEVDLHRFHDQLAKARALAGHRPGAAVPLLEQALDEWGAEGRTGRPAQPLADLPSRWAADFRTRLVGEYRDTVTLYWDALSRLGRTDQYLTDLQDFAPTAPTDERVAALLITALYRVGRPADALAVWSTTESQLHRCGLKPSPEFSELERQIRRHDPELRRPGGHREIPNPAQEPSADTGDVPAGEQTATDPPDTDARRPDEPETSSAQSVTIGGHGAVITGGAVHGLHIGNQFVSAPNPVEPTVYWSERGERR